MHKDLRFVDYFLFTQQSLATFDNCPLKFKKRYMENLKWDSFPSEEVKRNIERGNSFHLLANRYFMGIDSGLDEFAEEYAELNDWFQSLTKSFKKEKNAVYLPEYKLRMASGLLKLEANYDLVVVKDDTLQIWDWKTHSTKTKDRGEQDAKRLINSLQTVVYLFVLQEQSALVMGHDIKSEKISMFYWQPGPARVLAEIKYNSKMHERFRLLLEQKIKNIYEYDYSSFEKDLYSKHCRFCEFNWFCNNTKVDFKAMEEDEDILDLLDWESVEERF